MPGRGRSAWLLRRCPRHTRGQAGEAYLAQRERLWTEYVPTFSQVLYMELPRIAALSEATWSRPEKKDFKGFVNRLPRLLDIYEARDWNYAGHVFDVNGTVTPDANAKALKVTLSTFDGAPVRYTTDAVSYTHLTLPTTDQV